MNQSLSRWIGLLRKKEPVPAPPVAANDAPPERSVALLWTGPGLGSGDGEGF